MPIEKRIISLEEIEHEFPILEGWFEDPKNNSAQLLEGKRLMSARERLQFLGGVDLIKDSLVRLKPGRSRHAYMIVQACRQEATTSLELSDFRRFVEIEDIGIGPKFNVIMSLHMQGELAIIKGLQDIRRTRDSFEIWGNVNGYLTTEQGLRVMASRLPSSPQGEFFGSLNPLTQGN
jgi:hypothetical protein